MEKQLDGVFSTTGDMGIEIDEVLARIRNNAEYVDEFKLAFQRLPDGEGLRYATAAFVATLVTKQSRFSRFYLGGDSTALSQLEKQGLGVYRRVGCDGCHILLPDPSGSEAILLQDGRFHNIGVGSKNGGMIDLGRYEVTGRRGDWGAFRTPSLQNVNITAPYMHDGSVATLEAVIDFYAAGGISNPNLDPVIQPFVISKREKDALVAFLHAFETPPVPLPARIGSR